MTLFSSIQLAKNSLLAQQIGLQVTGNNIANANTPGYIRQRLVLTPSPTQKVGSLVLGLGVDVTGVVQQLDKFLNQRLRVASGDLASGETQEEVYLQLEALLGELTETDLSTSLNNFFGSIHDITNQPDSVTVRNLAVLQGETLSNDIQRIDSRVRQIRKDVNERLVLATDDVNRLLEEIARLNVQIVATENATNRVNAAVGLRDRRQESLDKLAALMDIRVAEQPSGSVTVFSAADFLVAGGTFREVETHFEHDRGLAVASVQLAATDAPLAITSGEIAGLTAARDEILGGFLDNLDDFTRTLIDEFNRLFTRGQGLNGYSQLTSDFGVSDADAALDQADLPFTPVNGSFELQLLNRDTNLLNSTTIDVRLHGLDDDTSLNDLAAALDGIDGLTAIVNSSQKLSISVDSPNLELAFAGDNSGVLSALGLATFFSGNTAANVRVNTLVRDDPAKFAASRSGIGRNVDNALDLARFQDVPLDSQNGASFSVVYDALIGDVVQSSTVARSVAEGFRTFHRSLESAKFGISGVSIDEEAVNMIVYQRAFQASARFIKSVSELLETLVNL